MIPTTIGDDPGTKRYIVDTEADIIAILRILASENVPLTIFQEGNTQLASTRILEVNLEFKDVILEAVSDPSLADGLCNTDELHVYANQQQVKIEFKLQRARQMQFQGKPALRVRVPLSLVGMERRENYRAKTGEFTAATLLIPIADQPEPLACRVVDISTIGCAIEVAGTKLSVDPGTILSDCVLDMPGVGKVNLSVEIRHSSDFRETSGHAKRRFGCQFVEIPGDGGHMIQSYIHQIDANR